MKFNIFLKHINSYFSKHFSNSIFCVSLYKKKHYISKLDHLHRKHLKSIFNKFICFKKIFNKILKNNKNLKISH